MPAVYEHMRSWLASTLGVDPKEITIIGSARIGQSLDPSHLGRPFSSKSDLDLTIVSADLFGRLVAEFNAWACDFESGRLAPANTRELKFWKDHLKRGPVIIGRGFLDSTMIPRRKSYALTREIAQTMFVLREKLALTPLAPVVRGADVRVYRSWDAFARQMAMSLSCASQTSGHGG